MASLEPMRLYRLLWLLLLLALRGRWRYEVHACVTWPDGADGNEHGGIASGPLMDISWVGADDAFVVLDAHSVAPMLHD